MEVVQCMKLTEKLSFLHIKYHILHCHNKLNLYSLPKYLGYYLEIEHDCVDLRFSQHWL